jgi:hypothetical protein
MHILALGGTEARRFRGSIAAELGWAIPTDWRLFRIPGEVLQNVQGPQDWKANEHRCDPNNEIEPRLHVQTAELQSLFKH